MTMPLPTFEYLEPETLDEVVRLLADPSRPASIVGGGSDLIPKMKRRQVTPERLVSLSAVAELRGIRTDDDGRCIIGASTLLPEIEASADVPPVLARAAGEVARICGDLVFGYNRHPSWVDNANQTFGAEELDSLEALMPGIASCARSGGDVVEADGSHPAKAGPCVRFQGMETFTHLRGKLNGCGTGSGLAKERAARALAMVEIPDTLDYPK